MKTDTNGILKEDLSYYLLPQKIEGNEFEYLEATPCSGDVPDDVLLDAYLDADPDLRSIVRVAGGVSLGDAAQRVARDIADFYEERLDGTPVLFQPQDQLFTRMQYVPKPNEFAEFIEKEAFPKVEGNGDLRLSNKYRWPIPPSKRRPYRSDYLKPDHQMTDDAFFKLMFPEGVSPSDRVGQSLFSFLNIFHQGYILANLSSSHLDLSVFQQAVFKDNFVIRKGPRELLTYVTSGGLRDLFWASRDNDEYVGRIHDACKAADIFPVVPKYFSSYSKSYHLSFNFFLGHKHLERIWDNLFERFQGKTKKDYTQVSKASKLRRQLREIRLAYIYDPFSGGVPALESGGKYILLDCKDPSITEWTPVTWEEVESNTHIRGKTKLILAKRDTLEETLKTLNKKGTKSKPRKKEVNVESFSAMRPYLKAFGRSIFLFLTNSTCFKITGTRIDAEGKIDNGIFYSTRDNYKFRPNECLSYQVLPENQWGDMFLLGNHAAMKTSATRSLSRTLCFLQAKAPGDLLTQMNNEASVDRLYRAWEKFLVDNQGLYKQSQVSYKKHCKEFIERCGKVLTQDIERLLAQYDPGVDYTDAALHTCGAVNRHLMGEGFIPYDILPHCPGMLFGDIFDNKDSSILGDAFDNCTKRIKHWSEIFTSRSCKGGTFSKVFIYLFKKVAVMDVIRTGRK